MRSFAEKFLITVCHALMGLAVVLIIFNILVLVTGQAASLNNLLSSDSLKHIFISEPGAYSDTSPEVLRGVLVKFYLPAIVTGAICGTVLVALLIYAIITGLDALGRFTINLIARRFGERDVRYRPLIIFSVWTVAIVAIWAVLNIDSTINYLLTGVALMVVDLLLGCATQDYVVDEAKNEIKKAQKITKESA